jgi:hypothetical protein
MRSGYLVLSMLALVIVLLALLLAAFYIFGSRTRQLRTAIDALRNRVEKIQTEILSTRTQNVGKLSTANWPFLNPPPSSLA